MRSFVLSVHDSFREQFLFFVPFDRTFFLIWFLTSVYPILHVEREILFISMFLHPRQYNLFL
jgi:hypothetical protein